MRILIGTVVILILASASITADDKIDTKKLIGKWEGLAMKGAFIEFAEKGKLIITADFKGETTMIEGTYTLEDNKITVVVLFPGAKKEQKDTITITKLTDTELITKDSKDKEDKFKRAK